MEMTLAEAQKRMIEAASDKSVSHEEFRRCWRRVVRIQEAATKEANKKIMDLVNDCMEARG